MIDYYKVLNIPRNASSKTIQVAYENRAVEFHPMMNEFKNYDRKFELTIIANEILSDLELKHQYDNILGKSQDPQTIQIVKSIQEKERIGKEKAEKLKKNIKLLDSDTVKVSLVHIVLEGLIAIIGGQLDSLLVIGLLAIVIGIGLIIFYSLWIGLCVAIIGIVCFRFGMNEIIPLVIRKKIKK